MKRVVILAILIITGTASSAGALPITLESGAAATIAGITPFRDQFRVDIGGGTTAGANGSFGGVRREINWDGVPAQFSAPNALPADFFNVNSPRGVVFSTPGTGFQVSGATTDAGAGQPAAANFGNINATYTGTFAPFSAQRLFTALGSTITDVNFFVPGTNVPAVTSAFGAIFSDVDLAFSSIEFFDAANVSLGSFVVPGLPGSQTFSFLGVQFGAPIVGRVRIVSGNASLSAGANDGGPIDLAVLDDFLYAEPVAAVPEPSTIGLTGLGLIALARRLRNRSSRRP